MTDQLRLSPAQSAYLDFESEWARRNADLLRGLGHDGLLELTGLMLAQRRALGLPTRLRAIAGRRFPQSEADILAAYDESARRNPEPERSRNHLAGIAEESRFLSPQPDGCGACMAEEE